MDKTQFKAQWQNRIPARWHMSLICMATIGSGILFSKGFLYWGMETPAARYVLAVLLSYAAFFFFVYIWLRLHFSVRKKFSGSHLDALDIVDIPLPMGTAPSANPPEWGGGGGQFSGGGASSSWGSPQKSIDSKSSLLDGVSDVDEGIVLVLLVAVILAICGSAGFIIYQAPEVLFEAAFEAVLVAGLLKKTKGVEAQGWALSVFKKTWWLFLLVLIAIWIFGTVIKNQCPEAKSFAEYRRICSK